MLPVAGQSGVVAVSDLATASWQGWMEDQAVGGALHGPGDLDDDGHEELLIGASEANLTSPGQVALVMGPVSGVNSLSSADVLLLGEHSYLDENRPGEQTGFRISSADLTGDGAIDLLIGARYWRDDSEAALGGAWLLPGGL